MKRTLHTQNLDETRRVLYIALAAMRGPSGGSAETAGTLANALAHHHRMLSPLEAQNLADEIVSEAPSAEAMQLVEALIRTITNQLERMTSLEEAIRNVIERDMFDDPTDEIVEVVRAWAKENAELYFGGAGGEDYHQHLAPSHYSVPLDKFGGENE